MARMARMIHRIRAAFLAAVAALSGRGLVPGKWHRRASDRDAGHPFGVQDGCLVRPDGQLPTVRDVTSPVMLGVHRAAPSAAMVTTDGDGPIADLYPGPPAYVPRSFDGELAERVAAGGFVLLVGDSATGKSRAAFEAIISTLPGHTLICPADRNAIAAAVRVAAAQRRCVLWLDNLERYLGAGGLTAEQVAWLLGAGGQPPGADSNPAATDGKLPAPDDRPGQDGRHLVIVATIRRAEHARLTATAPDEHAGLQVSRDARQVLYLAHPIRVARAFTPSELRRARARAWDPRIADALGNASSRGIAEHLAAGPELLQVWDDARTAGETHGTPAGEGQPDLALSGRGAILGAALVSAAVDIRRAGYSSPLPRALIDRVREHYLDGPPQEAAHDAWAWATSRRLSGTALLRLSGRDAVEVFDYLVDAVQRRAGCLGDVPEPVLRAAIKLAGPADADSIAAAAYGEGRYDLAEYAWRRVYEQRASDARLGPDHADTLATRSNLALALRASGQLDEAEAEHRAVVEAMTRVLGPDYPDTLLGRGSLASLLADSGKLEEAEAEHRAMLEVMTWVLGPDHLDALTTRGNIASLLHAQGRLEEAEAEYRAVADAMTRVLGPDDPETLTARNNLASVLYDLGRLEEAEAEHRAELEACARVLGPEHPDTLTSRGNLASVLRDLGRLEEAEAQYRVVADGMNRVLGPDHPDVLASRRDLAAVLRARGRLEQAEAEYRSVLDKSVAVLGTDHPDTVSSRRSLGLVLYARGRLEEAQAEYQAVAEVIGRVVGTDHPDALASRANLAMVLYARGLLEEAEAEQRTVADAMSRVLGSDHPDTLASRGNLALTLRALGLLEEAEAENRAVLESRTQVLGPDHPDTLNSRSNLAGVLGSRWRPGPAAKTAQHPGRGPGKAGRAAQRSEDRPGEAGPAGDGPGERPGQAGQAAQRPGEQTGEAGKAPQRPAGRRGKAGKASQRPEEQPADAGQAEVLSAETVS